MASKHRLRLVLCVVAILCLLAVPNLSQIGAESSENGALAEPGADEAADAESPSDVEETTQSDGEHEEDGDDEDDDEDGDGDDDEDNENRGENLIDESDLAVLGSNNFTAFVTTQKYVLVEFYAPWCGHCQELAPEWAAIATELKERVAVAKVDATANADLADKLGVSGYPTFFFFVDGERLSYSGERTKNSFLNYVNTKTSLTPKVLKSVSEAESLREAKSPIVIAYLNKLEGVELDEITSVARQEEGVEFYTTSDENVAAVFGLDQETKPALVLLKNVPDKRLVFSGEFKRKKLYDFVNPNKLPLVFFYERETIPLIFGNAIKNQILCFVKDNEHWGTAQPILEAVSRMFRGQALFIRVHQGDSTGQQASEYFGVTWESTVTIMAFVQVEDGPKYMHEGEFTVEGVKGFVEAFLANKLAPHYKSEPIPELNNEDVKTAVGKNFEEVVLDESKDTLLELYTPGCHYCEDLEPIYKKLAKRLRSIPTLSIVKMDGVLNEHPRARPDGYPTILFFPAGKKSFEPITFEGDRTVKGFYQFLKKHAGIPFALPRTAKSKPSNKAAEDVKDEL